MALHIRSNRIIAHHLILSGYGTWLANDLRGSGSTEVRKAELRTLGQAHFGRKAVQPSRAELKAFHDTAEPLLDHTVAWFDAAARDVVAAAVERTVRACGYTCYGFCCCSNHAHAMVRVHRDPGHVVWQRLADATRAALRDGGLFAADHPVWADRPYVVFKRDARAVQSGVVYIEGNPEKEGLPPQSYPWETPYDSWPSRRK